MNSKLIKLLLLKNFVTLRKIFQKKKLNLYEKNFMILPKALVFMNGHASKFLAKKLLLDLFKIPLLIGKHGRFRPIKVFNFNILLCQEIIVYHRNTEIIASPLKKIPNESQKILALKLKISKILYLRTIVQILFFNLFVPNYLELKSILNMRPPRLKKMGRNLEISFSNLLIQNSLQNSKRILCLVNPIFYKNLQIKFLNLELQGMSIQLTI